MSNPQTQIIETACEIAVNAQSRGFTLVSLTNATSGAIDCHKCQKPQPAFIALIEAPDKSRFQGAGSTPEAAIRIALCYERIFRQGHE